MSYPPPQQNQPPYGQQPPPYQQPPYGQQPPPYQQPPYGYPPQYPYQPPRNNSGAIIAVLVLILVIAGGVVAFLLLSNQGKCNPSDLAGTWRETNGLETLYITSNSVRAEGSGLVITGSYTCSGNTINWTLNNGQTTTLEVLDKTSSTMQLRNALGMTSNYRRQ